MACDSKSFSSMLAILLLASVASATIEGDIRLTDEQQSLLESTANTDDPFGPQNAVVRSTRSLWRDNTIPYILDGSLNTDARNAIQAAINDYTAMTCIRFRVRTASDADYVRFFRGNGCYSFIGRIGGPQDISIGPGCEFKGIVIHEIFHALGRWHEQSRPDRDSFVRVNLQNVLPGLESNFEKVDPQIATTQGVPYDFGSIMHYGARAFTRNGQNTLDPVVSDVTPGSLGQRNGLSSRDLQHVTGLYCGQDMGSWGAWTGWSACSRSCNGGIQTRTRQCVGGFGCEGSGNDQRNCNTGACPVPASWGTWAQWSPCSASCGSGRRTRVRACINGNTCVGQRRQFENCFVRACPEPPTWGSWGSWSDCSKTCQGGISTRTRHCQNGANSECNGVSTEDRMCNTEVPCGVNNLNWTECTKSCGGGMQWRGSGNNSEWRKCNTQPCHNEPCLEGMESVGCYRLPPQGTLEFLEDSHMLLNDDPYNRTEPVRKCGQVAAQRGYQYFAIALGLCFSGQHPLSQFERSGESTICQNGTGNYFGYFAIDVYRITDRSMFLTSAQGAENCGISFCMNSTAITSECLRSSSAATAASIISIVLVTIISLLMYV